MGNCIPDNGPRQSPKAPSPRIKGGYIQNKGALFKTKGGLNCGEGGLTFRIGWVGFFKGWVEYFKGWVRYFSKVGWPFQRVGCPSDKVGCLFHPPAIIGLLARRPIISPDYRTIYVIGPRTQAVHYRTLSPDGPWLSDLPFWQGYYRTWCPGVYIRTHVKYTEYSTKYKGKMSN